MDKEPYMNKTSMLWIWLAAVIVMGGCQYLPKSSVGKKLYLDFESETTGTVPSGWLAGQSDGKYPSATWEVLGDSWGRAMALSRSSNTGKTGNLLLATQSSIANLNLSAKVRSISGSENRSMGIIWRASNENNYYLACWEPKDNILRLVNVEAGREVMLGSVYVQGDPAGWHTLEIEHFRDTIRVFMDYIQQIELRDDTHRYPGMIGLWTQADSCAMFDDIRVREIQ